MGSSSDKDISVGIGVSTLLCWITCLVIAITLYLVFFYTPIENARGIGQRILYVHIAAIWIALLALVIVMVFSIAYLITTLKKWDHGARASAELGLFFCTLGLITGSLWAKQVQHVWWTWDVRLTTIFVLWLMYLAYRLLRKAVKGERGVRSAAVFGIIMFFDIPFAYLSILWWQTSSPVPVLLEGIGPGGETKILTTLLGCVITFTFLFCYLWQHRVAIDRMEDELEDTRRTVVEHEQRMRDFLVENQDFIIEDYTFKEYEKHE